MRNYFFRLVLSVSLLSLPGFLLSGCSDSIMQPSQIIVPVLNLNRHYAKGKPQDAHGAYPNDDTYQWFSTGADGQRVSRMPSFAGFSPQQIADLVAYLQTLGAVQTPKKEGQ